MIQFKKLIVSFSKVHILSEPELVIKSNKPTWIAWKSVNKYIVRFQIMLMLIQVAENLIVNELIKLWAHSIRVLQCWRIFKIPIEIISHDSRIISNNTLQFIGLILLWSINKPYPMIRSSWEIWILRTKNIFPY